MGSYPSSEAAAAPAQPEAGSVAAKEREADPRETGQGRGHVSVVTQQPGPREHRGLATPPPTLPPW